MPEPQTWMAREIGESPEAAQRFLDAEGPSIAAMGPRLRERAPSVIVTCARGSSDNAAGFFKYLAEILLGIPVASIGPSVASLYRAPLRLSGSVVVSVSQSGRSPDIVALQAAARQAGALAIAIVNDETSPLAGDADAMLPLHAGAERSVAATKTFMTSAVALAALVAEWRGDDAMRRAVAALPSALAEALSVDWSAMEPALEAAQSAYVLGRGPALPMALEAALKLKETAVLHAEAFSGAEVMHGPLQLVGEGFPVIAFRPRDAAHAAMGEAVGRLAGAGGTVFVAEPGGKGRGVLAAASCGEPLLDPLGMLLTFYGVAERVARARGHDPDSPSKLRKVTETM
jgi:glutamine---fructose-6-phosphate transaminase (isomerizing)